MKSHGGSFEKDNVFQRVQKLEHTTASPDLWNKREEAEKLFAELKRLKRRIDPWEKLRSDIFDLEQLCELVISEKEYEMEEELRSTLELLEESYSELQLKEWMPGNHDEANCFLTVHAGAGGTEACDWVSMLQRMYLRWAEKHFFKVETVDLMEAEGGIKSTTLEIKGDYAFGFLRCESGIHRLVRISPFDASKRRHTTFASVACSPVIDDEIEVEINLDDVRIDTYRASGAGGQHVNKTDSAVRMTHLPTNIVVQCQNERSQHKNRATALKILRSRLFDFYEEKKSRERKEAEEDKQTISWGNQIRSYVFQPYTLVKDHRTKFEVGDVQSVMDGSIDSFIQQFLKTQTKPS